MRFTHGLLNLAVAVLPVANAIYSDEAFHIDYHQALLGVPLSHTTLFHKPQISSNASLLYTISDRAVLGAVNPKDGSLLWRQLLGGSLAQDIVDAYLVMGDDGKVFSGYNGTVSAWDALDGRLSWDYQLPKDNAVKGMQVVPILGGTGENLVQDVIVVAAPAHSGGAVTVARVGSNAPGSIWEYKDTSSSRETSLSVAATAKHVYYISKSSGLLSGGRAKVVVIDITTGAEIHQYSVTLGSEPLGGGGSYVGSSCAESAYLVSSEQPWKSIKFNLLGNSKSSTLMLEDKGEEIQGLEIHHACNGLSAPHILVHVKGRTRHWAEIFHVDPESGDTSKAYTLPATAESSIFAASVVDSITYFTRVTNSEISIYSSESHGQLGRWPVTSSAMFGSLSPYQAAAEVSARSKTGLAVRVAVLSTGGEWLLLRNGESQWSRPEGLAYITKAVWSADVGDIKLAQEIEAEATSNPLSAYIHRIMRHIKALTKFPKFLMELPTSLLSQNEDTGLSTRQKLVGGKLILAATSHQELFALDAAHAGSVKWRIDLSRKIKSDSSVVDLLVEEGLLTVYFSDGMFAVVNTATGELLELKQGTRSFNKIVELPGQLASTIVDILADGTPKVFDDLAPAAPVEGSNIVTINTNGEAVGWSIGTNVQKVWTIRAQGAAKIVNAVSRPASDPIASIGKVLGDRSVLYKYITPNIALLTALSSTTLTIYLVNAVTGTVLYTSSHDGVLTSFPTPSVISENWFAYSFTSEGSETHGLYTQLIIAELYESSVSNDRGLLSSRTNYSSFAVDAGTRPYVISQAYTIAEPVSALTVSETLQGITSRQVLATLPQSNAILGIPRDFLNARRPVDRDPTALEAEEGLFRYSPILDLDPKFFLTHTREVIGAQKLMSAPTLLESTSIIFAYGHDIFGTQIAPSNTFDVLGKDFKRVQLVLTVVALYAGVLALRPLVRRKTVERRWA